MSENIKRIATEKMKVEKKLAETETKVKTLEEKLKKIDDLKRKDIRSELVMKKSTTLQDNDHSLDLNEFIEQNLNVANNPSKQKHRFALVNRPSKL